MLKQNNSLFLTLFVLCDLLYLVFAYLFSRYIHYKEYINWSFRESFIFVFQTILFLIILEKFEFSQPYRFRSYYLIIKNSIYFQILVLSFFYFLYLTNIYNHKKEFVILYNILTFVFFFVERIFIKIFLSYLRSKGFNYKRYLIIGAGKVGLDFYRKIVSSNDLGIKIVGFLDDDTSLLTTDNPEYTTTIKGLIIGDLDKIEMILKTKTIDNVIITLPMSAEKKIIKITNICEKNGVKAELIPDYFKITTSSPSVRQIKGYPLIGIRNNPLENLYNRFLKRMFDIVFASIALVLCLPLFIFIIIMIKLTSKGPVFFKQKRTGFKQKDFYILKFRTMIENDEADTRQATKDDPRKTKFGNFLRKYNLDELPQLINILKGEMSVIGPRPHMLAHTEEFYNKYDKYHVRHWVKPGLTGWAQVNGWRGDSDIGMRIKHDIYYIENWSLLFDLKIIFLTIFSKKTKKHAY